MWSIYNFGRRILELELLDMASNGFKTAGLEHGSMVKMSLVFLRLSTIERQAELNNISVNPQIRPESPVPSFALNTKKWVQMALSEIARLRQNHFWPYQIQSAQHNRAHNGTDAISKWPSWTRPWMEQTKRIKRKGGHLISAQVTQTSTPLGLCLRLMWLLYTLIFNNTTRPGWLLHRSSKQLHGIFAKEGIRSSPNTYV